MSYLFEPQIAVISVLAAHIELLAEIVKVSPMLKFFNLSGVQNIDVRKTIASNEVASLSELKKQLLQ